MIPVYTSISDILSTLLVEATMAPVNRSFEAESSCVCCTDNTAVGIMFPLIYGTVCVVDVIDFSFYIYGRFYVR